MLDSSQVGLSRLSQRADAGQVTDEEMEVALWAVWPWVVVMA